jgi:hypothetical protein
MESSWETATDNIRMALTEAGCKDERRIDLDQGFMINERISWLE